MSTSSAEPTSDTHQVQTSTTQRQQVEEQQQPSPPPKNGLLNKQRAQNNKPKIKTKHDKETENTNMNIIEANNQWKKETKNDTVYCIIIH